MSRGFKFGDSVIHKNSGAVAKVIPPRSTAEKYWLMRGNTLVIAWDKADPKYNGIPDGCYFCHDFDLRSSMCSSVDDKRQDAIKRAAASLDMTEGCRVEFRGTPEAGLIADAGAEAIVKQFYVAKGFLAVELLWDRFDPRVNEQKDGGYWAVHFRAVRAPKSNANRHSCWWCGARTIQYIGFTDVSRICEADCGEGK